MKATRGPRGGGRLAGLRGGTAVEGTPTDACRPARPHGRGIPGRSGSGTGPKIVVGEVLQSGRCLSVIPLIRGVGPATAYAMGAVPDPVCLPPGREPWCRGAPDDARTRSASNAKRTVAAVGGRHNTLEARACGPNPEGASGRTASCAACLPSATGGIRRGAERIASRDGRSTVPGQGNQPPAPFRPGVPDRSGVPMPGGPRGLPGNVPESVARRTMCELQGRRSLPALSIGLTRPPARGIQTAPPRRPQSARQR